MPVRWAEVRSSTRSSLVAAPSVLVNLGAIHGWRIPRLLPTAIPICHNAPVVGIVMFALAVGAVIALLLITRNAARLFRLDVVAGRVVSLRGRAPQGLVREMTDVLRQRPIPSATITVYVRDRAAAVDARGDVTDAEAQRLRNVVATWPVAKIRSSPYRSVG